MTPVAPPRWTREQITEELARAIAVFRDERMQESLEVYSVEFDHYRAAMEDLLELSVDLSELGDQAIEIAADNDLLYALRYLAGPPISADDLKTLAEVSLAPSRIQGDPEMARRIVRTVFLGLDRNRFPWVTDDREPTPAEREAAALASAALIATSRVGTHRRNESKEKQEESVKAALRGIGLEEVDPRPIPTLDVAPTRGQFCGETDFGGRKADIVVRLWDGRVMPIECKVSNSATNSIKRLNNDAAVKATAWVLQFGTAQTVPAAVLGGVYNVRNVVDAQSAGLTIFWAHALGALTAYVEETRE